MLDELKYLLLVSFSTSFLATFIILRLTKWHSPFTSDSTKGRQKFHTIPTPRIGGLSILLGILISILFYIYSTDLYFLNHETKRTYKLFLIALSPVFLAGFLEDITQKISPTARLVCTFASAIFVFWNLKVQITSSNIHFIDTYILQYNFFSLGITIFFIAMITNAFNIIDGFNGLMLGYAILVLTCFSIVSFNLNNSLVFFLSTISLSSIIALFIFNFPFGKIFSGDAGAYLIGFIISILSIMLQSSNSDISPWFFITICSYPITEVFFSIIRKLIIQKKSPFYPDGLHFHMIIYQRLTPLISQKKNLLRHSITSIFIWIINLIPFLFCLFFWDSTIYLIFAFLSFLFIYLFIYFFLITKRV